MPGRHQPRVAWKHLAVYGLIAVAVVVVGALAIWSFVERQSLIILPEPLPKVTLVTRDSSSRLAAAWVRLLTRADLNPTLVVLENFNPIEGVVVFCDIPEIPPRLSEVLNDFVRRGGALAFVGTPPKTPIGKFHISADEGMSDPVIQVSETASPVLTRITPGVTIRSEVVPAALLRETPRMRVDARWAQNSRAVMMHMEIDRGRYLWFGLDPDALVSGNGELMLILRSAFRWVAGQPVSEGAVGVPRPATTLSAARRREARQNGFAFSVDRAAKPGLFTVRMINRGGQPLSNPTVKIWLPPRVTKVVLAGDFIMKRNAKLVGIPEEGACVISLPSLTRNEDRVMKLRVVETQPLRPPA
jgi:hypothetical protein